MEGCCMKRKKLKQKGRSCFPAELRYLKVMTVFTPKVAQKLLSSAQTQDLRLKLSLALE